jgi:hypothetical protein
MFKISHDGLRSLSPLGLPGAGHARAQQREADQRRRGEDLEPADALTNEYAQRPPARG